MANSSYSVDSVIHSDQVPTLPEVAVEVLRICQQTEPSMDELTRVIRMDAAIAGRIVKFANSPLFGVRRTAATIDSAVVLMGTTMIRTLVLGFTLAEKRAASEFLRPHFQQIWRETLFQSAAAEVLGERHKGVDPAVWFLGGLLQDAGRLVMLNVFDQEYVERVIEGDAEVSLSDRERQAFGFTHEQVSAALCRTWGLGDELTLAVGNHHCATLTSTPDTVSIEVALQSANICNDYMEQVTGRPTVSRGLVERELIDGHGCRPDEVVEVLAEMDHRASALAAVLKADVGAMPSRETLLEKAQSALFQIALNEQLRRLNITPAPESQPAPAQEESEQSWLDDTTGTLRDGLLDRLLPDEIADSAAQDHTLGLLTIQVEADTTAERVADAEELKAAAEAVRACIRPDDQVVRNGQSGFVVLLRELSMNMLAKVARRITEQAADSLQESSTTLRIGGLMVVPAGKRAATIKTVLSGLEKSLQQASLHGTECFQLLHGKKLQAVNIDG